MRLLHFLSGLRRFWPVAILFGIGLASALPARAETAYVKHTDFFGSYTTRASFLYLGFDHDLGLWEYTITWTGDPLVNVHHDGYLWGAISFNFSTRVGQVAPATEVNLTARVDTPFWDRHGPPFYFTTESNPTGQDPGETRVDSLKVNESCSTRGMAVANAHAMLCSLNITDTPLGYSPPIGPRVDFTFTYNQRENSQPTVIDYSNMGRKWVHNWMAFVDESLKQDTPADVTAGTPALRELMAKVAQPGGGYYEYGPGVYSPDSIDPYPISFLARSDSRMRLTKVTADKYEELRPDGSKLVFGLRSGSRFFLTQVVDRVGNAVTLSYDASFRLTSLTDPIGQVSTFSYEDAAAPLKLTKVTDPFGRSALLEYNTGGYLRKITDVIGITSEFTYQGEFIDTLTTPYGTSTFAFGTSGENRWLTLTDPMGGTERVEYHDVVTGLTLGPLPTGLMTNASQDQHRYTLYWDKKAMAALPNNPTSAHLYQWLFGRRYNTSGALMAEKRPYENRVVYNHQGQVKTHTEGTAKSVTKMARVLDDGTTQLNQFEYTPLGHVSKTIDPLGRQANFIYASNGIDLLEVNQTTGTSTSDVLAKFTYNISHQPLTTTDAAGQVTTFTYNSAKQVRTITNAKNEVTTLWYHPTGQPAVGETLDPNATGYLVKIDGAVTGATTRIAYDAFGRPRTITDSEGYAVTTDYDAFDRPTTTTYPDGTFEQIVYDKLDPLSLRDRRGQLTTMTHNALRQLSSVTDALLRTTQYDWCKCGDLQTLTDPQGRATSWVYDAASRLIGKGYADGKTISYTYENTTSRLKMVGDSKGQYANYEYFSDDRLKRVFYWGAAETTPEVSFTYDPTYPRMATMTDGIGTTIYSYNSIPTTPTPGAGRLYSVQGPLPNATVEYTYDELGRVLTRSINGTSNYTSVTYDALGRVTTTTNLLGSFGHNYVNQTGRLSSVTYPNGQITNYGYYPKIRETPGNGDERLQQIQNLAVGGANLSTHSYTYDVAGVIKTWSQQIGVDAPLTSSFGYDAADQLVEATKPISASVVRDYLYRYDTSGNRTSEQIDSAVSAVTHNNVNQATAISPTGPIRFQGTVHEPSTVTVNGTPAVVDATNNFRADLTLAPGTHTVAVAATNAGSITATKNYSVTVASAAARTLVYDLNGNLIDDGAGKTYAWDAADRLIRITQSSGITEFAYDGASRRTQEKFNGTLIKQWVWCDGPQPCEERDGSNAVTKRFFPGGEQVGSNVFFYTFDHLGSIRELTDDTGAIRARYDYDPYGRRTKLSGDLESTFGFTGFYHHQLSGLSLALYRGYDPILGRWLSRDPIEELGGINLYRYVGSNPVGGVDLFGLREVTVAIWERKFPYVTGSGSVGHVAIVENNGKMILSQFPNPHGAHAPNSQKDYLDTVAYEGRRPDHLFKVFVPNDRPFDVAAKDHASRKWWDVVASNHDETNCSTSSRVALDQGGIPMSKNFVVTSPNDLLDALTKLSKQNNPGQQWYVKKTK
jgi:RHS repeat-associated protein